MMIRAFARKRKTGSCQPAALIDCPITNTISFKAGENVQGGVGTELNRGGRGAHCSTTVSSSFDNEDAVLFRAGHATLCHATLSHAVPWPVVLCWPLPAMLLS